MGQTGFPVFHILLSLAWTQLDCNNNLQLSSGAIAGVVLADLLLTLLLSLAVYYMASCIHRRQAAISGDLKKSEHESPYQELQGHRLDIYSDLRSPGVNYK
ncbi:TYRO protein tyrosine kinase-binding protein isoform X2 [Tiliqua scincoides]|uniref:TYRO protein tyrosine kinase-binding protein isoform X2 n=1 Tax=Tiliqua scincoides TaxID=71010 RepID=UPI003461B3DA